MKSDIENFDAFNTALEKGIHLIEASAGTGKTYTIARLVLRFIIEKGFAIEKILVVTFTRAATEELKDRIRALLAEVKRVTQGQQVTTDIAILQWLKNVACEKNIKSNVIQERLETALLNIDKAAIFTIHGFCQQILTEHALESQQLFNVELTSQLKAIKQFCSDDFWRREVYPRLLNEAQLLTPFYSNPYELLKSVNNVSIFAEIVPNYQALQTILEAFLILKIQAKQQWQAFIKTLRNSFGEGKFKDSYQTEIETNQLILENWLYEKEKPIPSLKMFTLFSYEGIKTGLNGHKFRAAKGESNDEKKIAYLENLALENNAFDELGSLIKKIKVIFRRALIEDLKVSVDKQLHYLNLMSFDDLIFRLARAIEQDDSRLFISALQQRFQVALIDEFQDTDNSQWKIFSTVFQTKQHYLYLIGDPKQAIYKFRGADIYSYLTAQQQAQYLFTLAKNWRSQPYLVVATNRLFSRKNAFLLEALKFHSVEAGKLIENGALHFKDKESPPLILGQFPKNNNETGYWSVKEEAQVEKEIEKSITVEIIKLLKGDCYIASKDEKKRLQPENISILVRTNKQARDYQVSLQKQGIPAIINSTESIYNSAQALQLYKVLQAVAFPAETHLVKQALSLHLFGFTGKSLYQLINSETELDAWTVIFYQHHQIWLEQGLMSMMQSLLKILIHSLAFLENTERYLTNLYHLIELLQQAAEQNHFGIYKTLTYLSQAIHQAQNSSLDEHPLRLESDAKAVKIVTMHRSKGLEYEVVFCPVLWQFNEALKSEQHLILCHADNKILTDLGSPDFEKHRQQAITEQLAEDLRVFYVAVTRAKYRCYLIWANVRSKETPNASAMAYLFDFAEENFENQQAILKQFSEQEPTLFSYQLLEREDEIKEAFFVNKQPISLKIKPLTRSFYSAWTMSSYTALATLSLTAQSDIPTDKSQEKEEISFEENTLLSLPKGSQTGNVIHALLEFNLFKNLAIPEYNITEQRDKLCTRFGLKITNPDSINTLLQTIVSTPLSNDDNQFCLKTIEAGRCLKEMPFYLKMVDLKINVLNDILKECPAFQPLMKKQIEGFLTGFIDLICEYQGKYYVMDYKTNSLDNYQTETIILAMREHNYGLQYWLYSLVLHLYLQARLPQYQYETHFGGVRYLFVRGMQMNTPMSGVYADKPDVERLQALARIFGIATH